MSDALFDPPAAPAVPKPEAEHDPKRLILLADLLRPYLRAGVTPLDLAQHVCDFDLAARWKV